MSFRKSTPALSGAELVTGYLDDVLVISFGISDRTSHFLEVTLEEVLRGHDLCEDLIKASSSDVVDSAKGEPGGVYQGDMEHN
jgi:hypothetical protein